MLKLIDRHARSKDDVQDVMTARLQEFMRKHGTAPSAFSLGPREFLTMQKRMFESLGVVRDPLQYMHSFGFHGVPVYPKVSPGVDMIIPMELVGIYCLGAADAVESETPKEGGTS